MEENFFAMCTTNLKFLSINMFWASKSPALYLTIYSFYAEVVSGTGNELLPTIYPVNKITLLIMLNKLPINEKFLLL